MAASLEVRIDAPIERVWAVIAEYARYPEFVPGVRGCRDLGLVEGKRQVEYEVDVGLRRIRYVLAHVEEPPRRVAWTLVRGDLLVRSEGAWELTAKGGHTLARYTADAQVARPPLVPRIVIDRLMDELTRVQVPAIVRAFKERAEGAA